MANHLASRLIVLLSLPSKRSRYLAYTGLSVLMLLSACSDTKEAGQSKRLPISLKPTLVNNVNQFNTYVQQRHLDVRRQTKTMAAQINMFANEPSHENLLRAQAAWQTAHESFLKLKPALLVDKDQLIRRIDAWPIQPGFLDSLPDYPTTGIVNDISIEISATELIHQHGITSDDEVALGYHSLEYLLFARKLSDYIENSVPADSNPALSTRSLENVGAAAKNVNRRTLMLSTIVIQLATDIDRFIIQSESELDDQSSSAPILAGLLKSLLKNMRQAFRESLLLNERDVSHGGYSDTSRSALLQELNTLRSLTLGEVNLSPLFTILDATNAKSFEITINQAIALAAKEAPSETEQINLDLTLSALLHQLEDFELALRLRLND